MRGRFDFDFGNCMLYGYWIYDGRYSMFGTMFLGVVRALFLVVLDGIKCENRGNDVDLISVVLTLYQSYHLQFSSHLFATLVSSTSIVLGCWLKNNCTLNISGIFLTGI